MGKMGGDCAPIQGGQNNFLGTAGAQVGCSSVFTIGVGWGVRPNTF